MIADKWEIGGSGSSCSRCGSAIEPEVPFFSLLVARPEEEGGLARVDLCSSCFRPDRDKAGAAEGIIAVWKTARRTKPPVRRPYARVDLDLVRRIFADLASRSGEGVEEELKYVLALLLLRRRKLELAQKAGNVLRFIDKKTEETFEITDPVLTEERIAELTARLGELLWEREFSLLGER